MVTNKDKQSTAIKFRYLILLKIGRYKLNKRRVYLHGNTKVGMKRVFQIKLKSLNLKKNCLYLPASSESYLSVIWPRHAPNFLKWRTPNFVLRGVAKVYLFVLCKFMLLIKFRLVLYLRIFNIITSSSNSMSGHVLEIEGNF